MNTATYTNDIYERFIRFGKVANKKERKKIAKIVSDWEIIPVEKSNIEKKYVDTINMFISDNEIKDIIKKNPNFQIELSKKLFELLENLYDTDKTTQYSEEKQLLNNFKNLKEDEFIDLWIEDDNVIETFITKYYPDIETEIYNSKFNNLLDFDEVNEKIDIKIVEKKLKRLKIRLENANKKENEIIESIKNNNDITENNKILKIIKKTKKEIKNEINQLENNQKLDYSYTDIQQSIISEWENKLNFKIIQEEIERIDKIRTKFLKKLYEEIEKLKKMLELLSPFMIDFSNPGRLWDMSKGNWHNVNFKLIQKYSEILEQQKELQELANLLGKYRRAETELEEEEFENIEIINKFKINHSGKSELIGITESNDLNHLLPTELALFSDLATESIFFKRYAEKKLQSYEFISKQKDYETRKTTETRQKEKELDKGPFILAIDTSGSMHGQPEHFAKVIAFAITKIALKEKRKAFLISFSTGIEKFELTNIKNSLPKLIEFLQMSFYGGTDATEAVKEAVNQMQTKNYKKADLLIITDGIFGRLDNTTLKRVENLKTEGNKFNSLIIGQSQNNLALEFCDNNWTYDFRYETLKKLITDIKATIKNP